MLYESLDKLEAKEEIRNRRTTGHLEPKAVKDLFLRATGDTAFADKIAGDYALKEMVQDHG